VAAPAAASAAPTPEPAKAKKPSSTPKPSPAEAATPAGVVDPMQWWGALTKQFTQLAAEAIKDSSRNVTKSPADAAVKPDGAAATRTPKKKPAKAKTRAADAAAKASGNRSENKRGAKTPS